MGETLAVETQGLTKHYSGVVALDNVNLRVREGEFLSIMGPSGSGKSTLLNLIGALDRPTKGEILVRGRRLSELTNPDIFRNREVGFIFQFHNLIPTLTAQENVEIPAYELDISVSERQTRAHESLSAVGLGGRTRHRPSQLSGGERQRVAIARALINDPRIILADEPTGELDSATGEEIISLMKRIARERKKTTLMVTHNPEIARKTDRIVYLRDGRIEREETVGSELLEDLSAFGNSSLGRRIAEGRAAEDLELVRLGIFEGGRLGRRGVVLRELISELQSTH
jgi:putative ABC transport system ATP-binding protein